MSFEVIRLVVGFPILFVLGALVVVTVRKPRRRPVEWAFTVMLLGLMLWLLAHNVSALATVFLYPSPLIYTFGSLAGVSFLLALGSVSFFCEFFPAGTETANSRKRIMIVVAVTLALAPLTFSRLWIDKRGEGAVAGPFYYLISAWAALLVLGWILVLAHKFFKHSDVRIRTDIRWFFVTLLSTVLTVVVFSLVLPAIGRWQLFFLGPSSAILLVSLAVYATLYRETLDFRSGAFKAGVRFAAAVLFVGFVMGPLVLVAGGFPVTLSAGFVAAFPAALLLGALYQTAVQPLLERLIRGASSGAEEVVLALFADGELRAHNSTLRELVSEAHRRVQEALGVSQLAFAVADHKDRVHFVASAPEPRLEALSRRLYYTRLGSDFEPPEDLLAALQPIFNIQPDVENPFLDHAPDFARRYPRVAANANRFLKAIVTRGYLVSGSLNFGADVVGYFMVGPKRDGHPLLQRDIELLNEIRYPLALIFRNQTHVHHLREVRTNAEAEIGKLTEVITRREVQRRSALGKTLIYRSAAMENVLERVRQVASLTRPVLITGETGTGKELIARLLHEMSVPKAPFISVNCAALPASLWESEIFGYVKGAFTDARQDRAGLVSAAAGGSLFFDEIGETPIDIQPKLLRLLQENQYMRLGSQKPEEATCRFLFATNRDLATMIEPGKFREDLFYRINVFTIPIPPLRERKEDIEPLIEFMLDSFAAEFDIKSSQVKPEIVRQCLRHSWPGNIRELENTILRALAAARGQELLPAHLPENIHAGAPTRPVAVHAPSLASPGQDFQKQMAGFARGLIVAALEESGWNKTKAAERLAIRRSSLDYRMRELGITRSD